MIMAFAGLAIGVTLLLAYAWIDDKLADGRGHRTYLHAICEACKVDDHSGHVPGMGCWNDAIDADEDPQCDCSAPAPGGGSDAEADW